MRDIVGIGALNADHVAIPRFIEDRHVLQEIALSHDYGGERLVNDTTFTRLLRALEKHREVASSPGGSAFTTIIALSHMGLNLDMGFVGVAGATSGTPDFVRLMDDRSIDHGFVAVRRRQPGRCLSVMSGGTRTLLTTTGANAIFGEHVEQNFASLSSYLANSRILHVSSFLDVASPEWLARLLHAVRLRNSHIQLSCDPGHVWCKERPKGAESILRSTDFLFLNGRELILLSGSSGTGTTLRDAAAAVLRRSAKKTATLVVKGRDRTLLFRESRGEIVEEDFDQGAPLEDENIVDDTGAGDVFAAGVLAALISRRVQMEVGLRLGHALALEKMINIGWAGTDFERIVLEILGRTRGGD